MLLGRPQRPSFTTLLLMRSNRGSHTVDFVEIQGQRNRLALIRPGQVQVWNTSVDFDATLVLSQPVAVSGRKWFPGHVAFCDLDDTGASTASNLIEVLRRQQDRFDNLEPTVRLMTSTFDALVALFDQADTQKHQSALPEVYLAYRDAIETSLSNRDDVVDYARDLGYSPRTITRACLSATGQTAKQVLTDRLVLEAKRLAVHSTIPIASISAQLGFSEATNFTKWFIRNTGQTPTRFRDLHRSPGDRVPTM